MPIVFAPPEPVAPGLSAAAGFAEEFAKIFPAIAQLQAHQLAANQASINQGPQSYQQAMQFQQAQNQAAGMQTQALAAQSNMQNAQQQATSQQIDQRSQNEMSQQQMADQWMQSQQWTSQDDSQLAQASNGWSQIQADPGLSNEEKQQAWQNYGPYIQSQQQRKQFWLTHLRGQQQQLMAEETMHQHAIATSADMQASKARAGEMQKMMSVQPIKDDDGNLMGQMVGAPTGDGKWNWHFQPVAKEQKDTSGQIAAKAYDTEVKHRDVDEKRWDDAHMKVSKVLEDQANESKEKDENGKPIWQYPNLHNNPVVDGRTVKEWQYGDMMNKMGYGEDKRAYLERKAGERAAMRGETSKPQTAQPTAAPTDRNAVEDQGNQPKMKPAPINGTSQTSGAAAQRSTERVPYDFNKPKEGTPQKQAYDAVQMFRTDLDRLKAHLSPEQMKEANDNLKEIERIWSHYGSPQAMAADAPSKAQERIQAHTATLDSILKQGAANYNKPKPYQSNPGLPNTDQGGFMAVPRF
jgi:hypothetical protein